MEEEMEGRGWRESGGEGMKSKHGKKLGWLRKQRKI